MMFSFTGNAQEAGAGGRSGAAGILVRGSLMGGFIYIYIIQILSVCVCVCVCLSVKYRRPNCWTDHDQIWHAYADRPGNGSYQILAP